MSNNEETLLTEQEERALLEAVNDDDDNQVVRNGGGGSENSSSSSSSSSCSSESSWNTVSSSSSSSRSASSDDSGGSQLGYRQPALFRPLCCDTTEQTRQLFAALVPSLFKERGVPVERVTLYSFDAAVSGWTERVAHVAVAAKPFSIGAMRAAFLLADLTPQVNRDALVQLRHRLRVAQAASAADMNSFISTTSSSSSNNTHYSPVGCDSVQKRMSSIILNQNKCSFDQSISVIDALLESSASSSSATTGESTFSSLLPQQNFLYAAKSYRRYLVRKQRTAEESQEELLRHVRDAHMSALCNSWSERLNERRVAPVISFLPVFLLVRERLLPVGSSSQAAAAASSSPLANNADASSPPTQAGPSCSPAEGTNSTKPPVEFAASTRCEVLSVEPLLSEPFVKMNNNGSFVAAATTAGGGGGDAPGGGRLLEKELFETAQAFVHFTYAMSSRNMLICDMQGAGRRFTDPQIHSINQQGFGSGNLGPKGMFCVLRAHKCNAVCRKLGLAPLDLDVERVHLQEASRKVKKGNLTFAGCVDAVSVPPGLKLPSSLSVAADFNF